MPRSTYTAAFKTKIVLEVLREEKELGEIAAEHNLNPNMVRNWKREFLENAETVFENPKKLEREAKRKEAALEKKNTQMLKTIGQLTLERDFLQDYCPCMGNWIRDSRTGLPHPEQLRYSDRQPARQG